MKLKIYLNLVEKLFLLKKVSKTDSKELKFTVTIGSLSSLYKKFFNPLEKHFHLNKMHENNSEKSRAKYFDYAIITV